MSPPEFSPRPAPPDAATQAARCLLEELNEARVGRLLSQGKLAEKIGTTQGAVSEALNARTMPNLVTAIRLAAALGLRFALVPDEAVAPPADATDDLTAAPIPFTLPAVPPQIRPASPFGSSVATFLATGQTAA